MTDRLLFSRLSLAFLAAAVLVLLLVAGFGLSTVRHQFATQWEETYQKTVKSTNFQLDLVKQDLQERVSEFDAGSESGQFATAAGNPLVQTVNAEGEVLYPQAHPASIPGDEAAFNYLWMQAALDGDSDGFEWCGGARVCVVHYQRLENQQAPVFLRAATVLDDSFLDKLKATTGDEFAMVYQENLLYSTVSMDSPFMKKAQDVVRKPVEKVVMVGEGFKARAFAIPIAGRGDVHIVMLHSTLAEEKALRTLLLQSVGLTAILAALLAVLFFFTLRVTAKTLGSRAASLAEKGRLASVGELASGVAHEVNNPLTAIRGYTQLLQRRAPEDPQMHTIFSEIIHEADHIHRIVQGLLGLARPAPHKMEGSCLVEDAIDDTLAMASMHGCHKSREVIKESDPDLEVPMPRGQLVQVLLNLVINALQASPQGSKVVMTSRALPDEVRISVIDKGQGISRGDLSRLFDPFFTTKAPGEGTGLGLSVSHRLVTEAGGRITVDSSPGQGSVFTVHLPRHRGASS